MSEPCPRPTRAAPGSAEKVAALAERVRAGLPLFHEGDATFADAEAGTAPRKLTDRRFRFPARPVENAPAAPPRPEPAVGPPPAPAVPIVAHEAASGSHRPVPALRKHVGTGLWHVEFKTRGRRPRVYFGCERAAAVARYRQWAAAWPAPLLAELPAVRDRARVVPTPAGPARLAAAARMAGLRPGTVAFRIDRLGWPVERALTAPTRRADAQEPSRITTRGA